MGWVTARLARMCQDHLGGGGSHSQLTSAAPIGWSSGYCGNLLFVHNPVMVRNVALSEGKDKLSAHVDGAENPPAVPRAADTPSCPHIQGRHRLIPPPSRPMAVSHSHRGVSVQAAFPGATTVIPKVTASSLRRLS